MSWYDDEASVILSAGPERVDTSDPDPDFEPRPVGFTASQAWATARTEPMTVADVEKARDAWASVVPLPMPLLWEGDQA